MPKLQSTHFIMFSALVTHHVRRLNLFQISVAHMKRDVYNRAATFRMAQQKEAEKAKVAPGLEDLAETGALNEVGEAISVGEVKVVGVNAVKALFKKRPGDLIRGYTTPVAAKEHFGPMMKSLADRKLAYHVVESKEIDRVAGSLHHEGVCVIAKQKPKLGVGVAIAGSLGKANCVILLENVGNPHNVGAILRVCAHFDQRLLLLAQTEGQGIGIADLPHPLSSSVYRIAEGAAEHVDVALLGNKEETSRTIRAYKQAGFRIVATAPPSKGKNSFNWYEYTETSMPKSILLMLGSEGTGLSQTCLSAADDIVSLPGSGLVQSLNVAQTSVALLTDIYRKRASLPKFQSKKKAE